MTIALTQLLSAAGLVLLLAGPAVAATRTAAVFESVEVGYAEPVGERSDSATWLRRVSVEERAGVPRRGELVRVPLFFSAGECGSLDELQVVPAGAAGAGAEVVWQADDVRRGPDGGISRLHAWLAVDLAPGEKRTFDVMKRAGGTGRAAPPMSAEANGGLVRIATENGSVTWGPGGELREYVAGEVAWNFGREGLFPQVRVVYPKTNDEPERTVALDRSSAGREVAWEAGPLFAKVRLRIPVADSGGMTLEQEYRLPRHGRELTISTALFLGDRLGGVVRENRLLAGRVAEKAAGWAVNEIPAGLHRDLRAVHAYTLWSLAQRAPEAALLAVPIAIGGSNGRWEIAEQELSLHGARNLQRGNEGEKETLHAFWTEVRLVPASGAEETALWNAYRERVQPLVAVVEEPGVTVEDLRAALRKVASGMKPVGWRQEAGRYHIFGQPARLNPLLKQKPTENERSAEHLLRGARNAMKNLTKDGTRKIREDEKGRAAGPLDIYHVTYTQSVAVALAELGHAPPTLAEGNLATAQAVKTFAGRVARDGSPYIDCFNRAFNMQVGPILFGLTAGARAEEAELVQFYRDVAIAPTVLGVFGRAQRPYTGGRVTGRDYTDYLYQAICDFWLRTTELLGGEDLQIHPLAYARYTDCVDVNGDRYHAMDARDKDGSAGVARANFFRGQSHTHRWLGWSCAPFLRLLEDPAEEAKVGLTEAVRYAQSRQGRWNNWPDLTFYLLADMLVHEALPRAKAVELPPRPQNVTARAISTGATISWEPVAGATRYHVFRAKTAGGPYQWLTSPHIDSPLPPVERPPFQDPAGAADAHYVVLAVDPAGRASAWTPRTR